MKSKIIFIIPVLVAAAFGIAAPLFVSGTVLWISEGGIILILAALFILYRKLVTPMCALQCGMSLLYAQDFASRLRPVGQRDTDDIVSVFNRMMEQLKNERLRVREQNHFLDLLIKASPMGIVVFDYDGKISSFNGPASNMFDNFLSEGNYLKDIRCELAQEVSKMNKKEERTVRLADNRILKCTMLSFVDKGFQRPFLLLESLTDEVMKAERAAYGKVIRVISHEVNNTLAGVIPVFDTVSTVSEDEMLREAAGACSERCASLSRFIKNYADVVKVPLPVPVDCNLKHLVFSLRTFLESLARNKNISIKFDVPEGDVIIKADPVLMEQVIVNIVKNSIESIGSDGEITIKVTESPIMLEISDNGAGISKEAASHLFAPFFSTKKGSQGIGLTLVAEILRNHHCRFRLATSADDGLTRFSIRF